jgi:hypothetical protein
LIAVLNLASRETAFMLCSCHVLQGTGDSVFKDNTNLFFVFIPSHT